MARQMLSSDGDPYTNSLKAVEYFAKNRRTGNQLSYDLFNSGAHKISDRYWHSNFAFQHAQGIPYKNIAEANEWSSCPDLTFILDVTPEEALSRIQNRDGKDRRKFEVDLEFTRKVRANYLELPRVLPELLNDNSIQIINGMRNPDEIAEEIWTTYQRFKN
jgi:dTMP kinase